MYAWFVRTMCTLFGYSRMLIPKPPAQNGAVQQSPFQKNKLRLSTILQRNDNKPGLKTTCKLFQKVRILVRGRRVVNYQADIRDLEPRSMTTMYDQMRTLLCMAN